MRHLLRTLRRAGNALPAWAAAHDATLTRAGIVLCVAASAAMASVSLAG